MLHIDESHHPIVVFTFDGALTDAELDALLERIVAIGDRKERIAYLMDATRADWLTTPQRQRLQEVMRRRRSLTSGYCAGIALVMTRSVPRVMLRAILAVSPLTVPHGVFGRFDDAVRFASQRLRAHGVEPPPGPIHPRGSLASYPPVAKTA